MMKKIGTVFAKVLAAVFLIIVFVEIALEQDIFKVGVNKAQQVKPFYWWSMVTHDGSPLDTTHHPGPLKLALHPFLIYKNHPNQRTDHFTINSHGFRGPELANEKNKKRIILIGGSTAFGTGLENDDETLARQLEKILDAQVINAAVIGHASGQELAYLVTELVDLHPNLVIALDGLNDYSRGRQEIDNKDAWLLGTNGFEQIEDQLKTLRRLEDPSFWTRASHFHEILFPRITASIISNRYIGFVKRWVVEHPDVSSSAEIYAKNIIKIHKMGSAFQYNFLCVLQPDKEIAEQFCTFREISKRYFDREKVKYLDLEQAGDIKTETFMDNAHLDAIGNKVIAEIISKTIIAERLLSSISRNTSE